MKRALGVALALATVLALSGCASAAKAQDAVDTDHVWGPTDALVATGFILVIPAIMLGVIGLINYYNTYNEEWGPIAMRFGLACFAVLGIACILWVAAIWSAIAT